MDIFGENWTGHIQKIKESWRQTVTDGDLVLLSGDFSWAMSLEGAAGDFEQISALSGKKVMIRGNHDYWWNSISKVRKALPENFFALQNDAAAFGNFILCGSRGWVVPGAADFTKDDQKIYLREAERLKMSLAAAARLKKEGDTIVAMMHFPPFNAQRDSNLFTETFEKFGVKKAVYGHLHGTKAADISVYKNGVEYILTSCDALDFKLKQIF